MPRRQGIVMLRSPSLDRREVQSPAAALYGHSKFTAPPIDVRDWHCFIILSWVCDQAFRISSKQKNFTWECKEQRRVLRRGNSARRLTELGHERRFHYVRVVSAYPPIANGPRTSSRVS